MQKKTNQISFTFPIWWWLFRKIRILFLPCLLFSFLICYFSSLIRFNVRNNFNAKNSNYGQLDWIFYKQDLHQRTDPQWHLRLLITLLLCFLFGVLVLDFICRFLQDCCINLNKLWLQKLIIYCCFKTDPLIFERQREQIKEIIFNDAPRLAHHLVSVFLESFKNSVGIILEIYFLHFFLKSRNLDPQIKLLAFNFNLIIILFFLIYIILTARLQRKKKKQLIKQNQDQNKQISQTLNGFSASNQSEKKAKLTAFFQLCEQNFQKLKIYSWQESFFSLPALLIPGLSLCFYFFYYCFTNSDFSGAFNIYLLSLCIQSIFWKLQGLFRQIPKCHEIYSLHNNIKKLLIKLLNKNSLKIG